MCGENWLSNLINSLSIVINTTMHTLCTWNLRAVLIIHMQQKSQEWALNKIQARYTTFTSVLVLSGSTCSTTGTRLNAFT